MRGCDAPDCDLPHAAKGLCQTHYKRMRKHGSFDDPTPTWEQRFWSKVDKTDGCWLWTAGLDTNGYGNFQTTAKRLGSGRAHRVAYILLVGPVPEGLQLDHLCRVRRCVNPGHLEAVTASENVRRAYGDHCRRGHPLTQDNIIVGAHGRQCRACARARQRDYYQRTKAA